MSTRSPGSTRPLRPATSADRDGDRALALGQHRRQEAAIARLHDGRPGDRNARGQAPGARRCRSAAPRRPRRRRSSRPVIAASAIGIRPRCSGLSIVPAASSRAGTKTSLDVGRLDLDADLRSGGPEALHDVDSRAASHDQRRKDHEKHTHDWTGPVVEVVQPIRPKASAAPAAAPARRGQLGLDVGEHARSSVLAERRRRRR